MHEMLSGIKVREGGKTARLGLPWPDRRLSPNAAKGSARRLKATIVADARKHGWARAMTDPANDPGTFPLKEPLGVCLSFFPPDRRRRDTDNLVAMMKPYLDGVAEAVGVDDYHWNPKIIVREETIMDGGAVLLVLVELADD